jgi:hypothetical protein
LPFYSFHYSNAPIIPHNSFSSNSCAFRLQPGRKKIRLIQADEAVYDKTLGADVQRIIGNAVFEHEGAYCIAIQPP